MKSSSHAVVAVALTLLVAMPATPRAQDSPAERFEVASIIANRSLDATRGFRFEAGNSLVATGMALRDLIWAAYATDSLINASQIVGGPSWLLTERFDIKARGPAGGTASAGGRETRTLAMLRALLEERFQVRVHMEQRSTAAYGLVPARRDGAPGPALHKSAAVCETADWTAPAGSDRWCGFRISRGEITARGISMFQLAATLGNHPAVGRPVRDRTGVGGTFDFHIEFAPGPPTGPEPLAAQGLAPSDARATFFTALSEQLGLKLESEKVSVDVLVIDQAARPTPD